MNEESKGLQASATKVRIDGQVTATPPAVGEFAVQERAQLLATIAELKAMLARVIDAEFEYGGWPSEAELRQLLAKSEGVKP